MSAIPINPFPPPMSHRDEPLAALRKATEALEASFLAELLKTTAIQSAPEGFGGGAGEEQFASLLTDERAKAFAKAGGIGLAASIFEALKGYGDGQGAG